MWNSLSWAMEADAQLIAIVLSNDERMPSDWESLVVIILLLLINSAIGFYEGQNADNAVKALMGSFAPKANVKHDGN